MIVAIVPKKQKKSGYQGKLKYHPKKKKTTTGEK